MKRLCVTPCGSAKIWDKYPSVVGVLAKNMYTGSFTKACQAYANRFFDAWVIMSAKYGFISPDEVIPESYDECFHRPGSGAITIQELKRQTKDKHLDIYDEIVVVASKRYCQMVQSAFDAHHRFVFPLMGCGGIGNMIQKLNRAVVIGCEIESTSSPFVN